MVCAYRDKYGEFFGRINKDGNVAVLHAEDGSTAARLDADVYPSGSDFSARHERAASIAKPTGERS